MAERQTPWTDCAWGFGGLKADDHATSLLVASRSTWWTLRQMEGIKRYNDIIQQRPQQNQSIAFLVLFLFFKKNYCGGSNTKNRIKFLCGKMEKQTGYILFFDKRKTHWK